MNVVGRFAGETDTRYIRAPFRLRGVARTCFVVDFPVDIINGTECWRRPRIPSKRVDVDLRLVSGIGEYDLVPLVHCAADPMGRGCASCPGRHVPDQKDNLVNIMQKIA